MKRKRRTFERSVRYAPRINARFLKMLGGISERHHMPEADVLRYCFEAAILTYGRIKSADVSKKRWGELSGMMTVRTTEWMGEKAEAVCRASREVKQADVLRTLLERILPIARDKGMAHVMRLRETSLSRHR